MPAMYYEKVFHTFRKYGVRYLIAGGMAVNLYGVPRFTKDLDILIDPSTANLSRLKKAVLALGLRPKIPVSIEEFLLPANWKKWKQTKGMAALTLFHPKKPYEEIDLLVNLPLTYAKARKRSIRMKEGGLTLPLVSIQDLIGMKVHAGRMQDHSDILALKQVIRESDGERYA
ncbi:MAG: nucleotidyl transferase AbiEii/AbiGii toxin family protein [Candidatus Omnitrophota bacterium]